MKNASETKDGSNLDHFVPHASNDILIPAETRKAGENNKEDLWDQDPRDCERLADMYSKEKDAVKREDIAAKLGQYLTEWEAAYKPSAELIEASQLPLDQKIFTKMFSAAAKTWEGLADDEKEATIKLAKQTVELDDTWWVEHGRGKASHNNRYGLSLNLHASAAALLIQAEPATGSALAEATSVKLNTYIMEDVDAKGSTIDFRERDSLHYHVFGLQPLLEASVTLERLGYPRSPEDKLRLVAAVKFLEPYIKGDQVNIEFEGTINPQDIPRNKDTALKPYQIQNQSNNELRHLLETAARILPNDDWIPRDLALTQ